MGSRKNDQQPLPESPSTAGLRSRTWQRFLQGPDPLLLDELYVPGLAEAVRYDRCCAYFSSSVLAAAARGFGRLIQRLISMGNDAPKPAVRLIVNEELSSRDVRAMTETGDTRRLEEVLKKRLKNPKDLLERRRLAMLGWLVKEGLLSVRVGVMRHGTGIVHAKYGIITDPAGDAVIFCGSGNESAQGLVGNYEQLELSTSWDDGARHGHYQKEFDLLWKDNHGDVHTVTLPEALRLKLIKFAPKEPPIIEPSGALARQKAAMIWQYIVEAPFFPDGGATCDATAMVDLWPHQRHVVSETADAWPDGRLLCDEVGMGKTIEAILVLRRLMAGRGVRRALLLVPAGLLRQWQGELREKGGLIVPRLEGINTLVWPDDSEQKTVGLADALKQDMLLMSRETARTERNLPIMLEAEPWDIVLLDEAHAARRRKQEEGEFNTGNLLLNLLRQLQLRRRARGILLLSATPMQTHPWEPWDLLSVLGEGGMWLADFSGVRNYYQAIASVHVGRCDRETADGAAAVIAADKEFPDQNGNRGILTDQRSLATQLMFTPPGSRKEVVNWLRRASPLARRMHRNTRTTLRRYHQMGLLNGPPPNRKVTDMRYDYEDARERQIYDAITGYIEKRFDALERERAGKGFVMTVYRRRAASSPRALEESLRRRREGLELVIRQRAYSWDINRDDAPEAMDSDDLPEDVAEGHISSALPDDPEVARQERASIDSFLDNLRALGACDSKRDKFFDTLRGATDDGRPALVFTEYADTLMYLRDSLVHHYGERLGCYSGSGGAIWNGMEWKGVTKDSITHALSAGQIAVLICTDAASEGLNLQAAGAVINYDLPWNPSKVEQRIGRIDRIGQRYQDIRVVNLFLSHSVDERVYAVLRQRCNLFEHFVGAMQPVLARARRMLMGQEPASLEVLSAQAGEVERDNLIKEIYLEGTASGMKQAPMAVHRDDVEMAFNLLRGDFEPRAVRKKGKRSVEVRGLARKISFAPDVEALEADRSAIPMSPLVPQLRDLASRLVRAGERLPLVIGSFQEGPFRSSVAVWVQKSEAIPVKTLRDLAALTEEWDGTYPDPDYWHKTQNAAAREAAAEVRRLRDLAVQRENAALHRQLQACKQRLIKELGRYLVCVEGSAADLNEVLHRQMSRDIASAQRLHLCKERLDGYPEWSPNLCVELETFYAALTEGQRAARLFGSELDAALDDPRWAAQAMLQQLKS